jgi:hypothetical protein
MFSKLSQLSEDDSLNASNEHSRSIFFLKIFFLIECCYTSRTVDPIENPDPRKQQSFIEKSDKQHLFSSGVLTRYISP